MVPLVDADDGVVGDKLVANSRKHVAGVNRRKSHGCSFSGDGDDSCDVNDVRKSHAVK